MKPCIDDPDGQYYKIPNSTLAIRIWDGRLAEYGSYCLDMLDVEKRIPCNTPESHTMCSEAYPGRHDGPQLVSWEAASEVTDISRGEERHGVPVRSYVVLQVRHPNETLSHFQAPLRASSAPSPGIAQPQNTILV